MSTIQILSPFPPTCLPIMWEWMQEYSPQMLDDQAPQTLAQLKTRQEYDEAHGGKSYIIYHDGLPVGAVWAEAVGDGMFIGHLVFAKYVIRPEEKLQATRDAVNRIFADGARKIIWQLFADNRAFKLFLLRLGAVVEGKLRQGTRRKGELVDLIIMASFPEAV